MRIKTISISNNSSISCSVFGFGLLSRLITGNSPFSLSSREMEGAATTTDEPCASASCHVTGLGRVPAKSSGALSKSSQAAQRCLKYFYLDFIAMATMFFRNIPA